MHGTTTVYSSLSYDRDSYSVSLSNDILTLS
nr:MAG TPA: hypothetical protein [Caudoviricetes sp.]